jgi:hypothetical protein
MSAIIAGVRGIGFGRMGFLDIHPLQGSTYTATYTATYTEWLGKDLQGLVRT